MACQAFTSINFRPASLAIIDRANEIIEEYLEQGLKLTLRQLYYQFVSRDYIPNTRRSYKNLGSILNDGRLAGLVDWDAIEDRGRQPRGPAEWANLKERVEGAMSTYRLPRWEGQPNYVELWVEKDALAGVLEPLAWEFHVTLMVNKGYSSQSAMYEASKRFLAECRRPKRQPILFYLGDHDPSGEDMVRDIRDRLTMFGVEDLRVEKLALTMAQVKQYNPPPNPAKMTDARANGYVEKHGHSSWEVDALPPNVLSQIIRMAFRRVIDTPAMNQVKIREEADRKRLMAAVEDIMAEDGE